MKFNINVLSNMFKFILVMVFFVSYSAKAKIEHVRVIFEKEPTNEALIAWTTDKPKFFSKSYVYFDTVSRKGKLKAYKHRKKVKRNFGTWYGTDGIHRTTLKKLKPDTKYFFVVRTKKYVSKEYHFITAPKDKNKNFKLLFGGDSRTDREMRQNMNKKLRDIFEAQPDIYALVHGGDFINNGFKWKEWKAWFEDHLKFTTTSKGRILPIIPTRGNHEASMLLYNQLFGYPGGLKNYFVTEIGNLAIVTLNTNISMGGFQKRWLKKKLKKHSKSHKWIVTNYHAPAWPAVKKPSRAKKHWVPYFERYQVDLVFESDGHALKKTAPIYDNKVDLKKGIIYVGEGGLGVKQRRPKNSSKWYLQSPGYAASKHHVMLLDVKKEKMDLSIILADGSLYDKFSMKPRAR